MIKVLVPGPLRSYTGNASTVTVGGATLGELLWALDRAYPGMRFRMIDEQDNVRRHIRFFVNAELRQDLATPLAAGDELQIICAISGG